MPGFSPGPESCAVRRHTQTTAPSDDDTIEEIVVTGSRLVHATSLHLSPITTVDRAAIDSAGQPTIEETLNHMPQILPDYGRTSNNYGDSTARINLRGLGSNRTLVLLNGRRLAPSGISSSVDINNLPQVLIDRVEIITGGATTVYGSDAVAGVVNFILREDFDGVAVDASAYATEQGDSEAYDLNVAWGTGIADDRGHATLYGGWLERDATFAGDRAFTETPLHRGRRRKSCQGAASSYLAAPFSTPRSTSATAWHLFGSRRREYRYRLCSPTTSTTSRRSITSRSHWPGWAVESLPITNSAAVPKSIRKSRTRVTKYSAIRAESGGHDCRDDDRQPGHDARGTSRVRPV